MSSNKQRPVNLNLPSFKFPPMALVSISHRISGFFLYLALPWVMYLFSQLASTPNHLHALQVLVSHFWARLLNWLVVIAAAHHVVAGTRHLIMDMGWGESLRASKISAIGVLVILFVIVILTGVWIW